MGSLTVSSVAITAITALAFVVVGLACLCVRIGYELGVKHTEERWDHAVRRAGVATVRRCGICGFNRGEGTE